MGITNNAPSGKTLVTTYTQAQAAPPQGNNSTKYIGGSYIDRLLLSEFTFLFIMDIYLQT